MKKKHHQQQQTNTKHQIQKFIYLFIIKKENPWPLLSAFYYLSVQFWQWEKNRKKTPGMYIKLSQLSSSEFKLFPFHSNRIKED